MFCRNCGTEFEGKFCPKCGTAVQPEPSTAPTPAKNGSSKKKPGKIVSLCIAAVLVIAVLGTGVFFGIRWFLNRNTEKSSAIEPNAVLETSAAVSASTQTPIPTRTPKPSPSSLPTAEPTHEPTPEPGSVEFERKWYQSYQYFMDESTGEVLTINFLDYGNMELSTTDGLSWSCMDDSYVQKDDGSYAYSDEDAGIEMRYYPTRGNYIAVLADDEIHRFNLLELDEEWYRNRPFFQASDDPSLILQVSYPSTEILEFDAWTGTVGLPYICKPFEYTLLAGGVLSYQSESAYKAELRYDTIHQNVTVITDDGEIQQFELVDFDPYWPQTTPVYKTESSNWWLNVSVDEDDALWFHMAGTGGVMEYKAEQGSYTLTDVGAIEYFAHNTLGDEGYAEILYYPHEDGRVEIETEFSHEPIYTFYPYDFDPAWYQAYSSFENRDIGETLDVVCIGDGLLYFYVNLDADTEDFDEGYFCSVTDFSVGDYTCTYEAEGLAFDSYTTATICYYPEDGNYIEISTEFGTTRYDLIQAKKLKPKS